MASEAADASVEPEASVSEPPAGPVEQPASRAALSAREPTDRARRRVVRWGARRRVGALAVGERGAEDTRRPFESLANEGVA
ncbi:hypothetical protein ACFFX0_16285 [Citricoccus parietis]|uniref:Uncharacterized protein n=1 Tax=Citricoccus parietis TaxID=592307 RepID=A0ABV5G159_9MICC